MTTFIDLQRRFRDLTAAELEDPELLASLNEHKFGPGTSWSELLKNDRVLVLAEAGAGKTIEMVEQAKRLVGEGRFAFFVALESLDREPLVNLLSATEERRFATWKAESQAPAWFFLDAVDELKLTEGKLDRALLRLARKLNRYSDNVSRTNARIAIEPWIVEAALARLGSRRLTIEEQRTVVTVTRTPHKVSWPEWWEASW